MVPNPNDRARAHLFSNWFGGPPKLDENFVPFYQAANLRMKNLFEGPVARELKSGRYEAIYTRVVPIFDGDSLIPKAMSCTAVGEDAAGNIVDLIAITIFNQK